MDQDLAVDCIEVVESLSQKEKNKILSVLKRDDKLRVGQEHKISQLKQEINDVRKMAVLRAGDDQTKMCIRCRAQFGIIFNRGDICPACRFKVCNLCQELLFNKSWLCKLCYKQRQLKWLTGEWAASFEQNPLRKWASGSDINRGSFQVFSGATSIDIGEPERTTSNNNRSSKSARNGVLTSSEQEKQRVEYPKEADQHKLSQLFGVLRSRKPEVPTKELEVRRVSTRKYSETDSDSSSSSDVEAPSVTESELDKTESPRRVESPKSRLDAVDEDLNETVESDRMGKQNIAYKYKSKQKPNEGNQQELISTDLQETDRIVRPKVAHSNNRPKTHRTELDPSDTHSQTQPRKRERKKIMPDQTVARELRIQAGEVSKVSQSKSVEVNLSDPGDNKGLDGKRKVLSHTELNTNKLGDPYASRSHESLDKNSECQIEGAFIRKSHENLESSSTSGKRPSPVIRHSAENLSPKNKNNVYNDTRRSHENLDSSREKSANQNIRQARSHEHLPARSRQTDEQMSTQSSKEQFERENVLEQKDLKKPGIDIEVTHAGVNVSDIDREVQSEVGVELDNEIKGQRAGSPYSFSMDSLPSSNPSPTLRRSIDSSIPESSDTDSLSKFSHHEGGEFSGTESQVKEISEDDFDVEEISKVRFQRMSRKAAQMSALTKISSSPKRPGSYEGVDRGQRKSQSRGGSGGKDISDDSILSDWQNKTEYNMSLCKSPSVMAAKEPVVEETVHCAKKQTTKEDGETKEADKMNDQKLIVNRGKTVLKRLNVSASNNLSETLSPLFSAGSEPKSATELSWFDEYSMDTKEDVLRQTKVTSDVQVFVDDKDIKDNADSDTDSVEGMIDNMVRPHLQVEIVRQPSRASEADSEVSFHMTPMSPFPPDTFETKVGTYTLTYMESDDNLDTVSTDDNLDVGSDVDSAIDTHVEEIVEKKVVTGRIQKQKLKAKNSLDFLIEKQRNLLEPDQDIVDIDSEFSDALRIANENDSQLDLNERVLKVSQTICPVKDDGSLLRKARQQKAACTDYDSVNSPVRNQQDQSEVRLRMMPGRNESASKSKLVAQKSLDLLILNQGELIDPAVEKVDLESELRTALEQHTKESRLTSLEFEDIVEESERNVDYLGMQKNVGKTSAKAVSPMFRESDASKTTLTSDDGRETSSFDTTDGTPLVLLPVINRHRALKRDIESDSEESDILSVIEEEEEFSETSEHPEDNKMKVLKTAGSTNQNVDIDVSSKNICLIEDDGCEDIEKKLKISDKIKAMENRVKQISKNSESAGHEKYEGYDVKVSSKFKKLQERWNAIEKHEADLLDVDENSDCMLNNHQNKTDEKAVIPPVLITDVSGLSVSLDGDLKTDNLFSVSEDDSLTENSPDIEEPVTKSSKNKVECPLDIDWSNIEMRLKQGRSNAQTIAKIKKMENSKEKEDSCQSKHDKSNIGTLGLNISDEAKSYQNVEYYDDETKDTEQKVSVDTRMENHQYPMKEEVGINASPSRHSISDKAGICQSVTDLSNEGDASSLIERSAENVEISRTVTVFDKSGQDLNTPQRLARCQSSGEDFDEQKSGVAFQENASVCQSIAEDDTDAFYFVPQSFNPCVNIGESTSIEYDEKLFENVFLEDSEMSSSENTVLKMDKVSSDRHEIDETETGHKPLVRLSKSRRGIKISDPAMRQDLVDLDRTGTYVIKKKADSLSSTEESKEFVNVEITDLKTEHGHEDISKSELNDKEENDSIFPPEPQYFKVPNAPLKSESQMSSSSVPSSPDLSLDLPFTQMDSSKSDKITSHRTSPQTISESSTSQDDSGLASGGSRGATPEHKRTDSGYSQSSLPSTLSTVTDRSTEEEEDIDRVLAKMKASGGRGNLLSVVADSRESIASFYSDAGDIAYSNIPVTGEVLFGLNYNYKVGMLEVHIKQCRDIAAVDAKRHRSDPYVKTYLLPDKTRSGKRKTKVKKHTLNPTFDENLKYSISKSELENRTLWLTVWHNDRFGRNDFLGEVTINFDYFKFDDPSPKWYPLQERLDTQPTSILTYKGDIVLSIRYVTSDKVKTLEFKGKPKRDAGKGQLHVVVKEARNLTAVRSNGFSDPFCKGYLLPERHRSSKQKTAVIKKNCNPGWNHTFVFEDVSVLELQERCLELTIWDYEKLASNDFLGGVRLNLGTGLSQGKQVDWMDARGEEMTMWQAMLDRPNIWIDGTLILRPNMQKRKF